MQNRDRDEKKSRSRFSVEIGEASPIDLAHTWFVPILKTAFYLKYPKGSITQRQKRGVFALVLAILSLLNFFFMFLKRASLMQKRRVFVVM